MKKFRKHITTFLLILVFVVGVGILLYPTVSNYWNSMTQSRVITNYQSQIDQLSDEDYQSYLDKAAAYNKKLMANPGRFVLTDADLEEYNHLLNVLGDGVMGYLEIPKLNVKLPIYHGTNEAVLQVGIGHYEGSSLPVGGLGSHAVITGHRGLPSAELLSRLDKMEVGDRFKITVLDELLTYEVDQVNIVLPDDTSLLGIEPDKDLVTLITCTPYGINSHRLLVRGHRVANDEHTQLNVRVVSEARPVDTSGVTPVIVAVMLIGFMVFMLVKYRTKKR